MTIHFFEPPPALAAGGLSLAIESLEAFLRRTGTTVNRNPPLEALGREGREVAHFHGLWQAKYLKVSAHCRRAKIPYVVSPHGMLEPWAWRHKRWKKWPWFHLVERHYLSRAAALLATSETEEHHLRNLFPTVCSKAIPLGLTGHQQPQYELARRTLGWAEAETVLLFLSRVHPKKGLHLLLQALARVDTSLIAGVRLVIVGGGENGYIRELKAFEQREQRRLPRIDWVGEVWGNAKWVYFQGADLFCLPSFSENFGLAILEALQVGTRVLTTPHTPWSAIPSWGAGLLVDPVVHKLQTALAGFFANPAWTFHQRARLAADVHARFSWDLVGPRYIQFYEHVIRNAHLS